MNFMYIFLRNETVAFLITQSLCKFSLRMSRCCCLATVSPRPTSAQSRYRDSPTSLDAQHKCRK
jgi:hypothetical protein